MKSFIQYVANLILTAAKDNADKFDYDDTADRPSADDSLDSILVAFISHEMFKTWSRFPGIEGRSAMISKWCSLTLSVGEVAHI